MNEQALREKLRRIEALFAGAATEGERYAAAEAARRITARLEQLRQTDRPVEIQFSIADIWSRHLFVALLRRYGLEPYRHPRQRRTTIMVRAPRTFVDRTLWPVFEQLNTALHAHLSEITDKIIAEAINRDLSEPTERPEVPQIPSRSF
jgi:hypothetical protein